MILTKQHQDEMDKARAELLSNFNEADLDMSKLLIINGAHTAGFIAGLECTQARSAAPALLAALRDLLTWADFQGDPLTEETRNRARAAARAALARVEAAEEAARR